MRPQVPEVMKERMEEFVDDGYYVSAGEFVRDAVRRRLDELEEADTE